MYRPRKAKKVNNKPFNLNDLTILPFDIPHDAADPCGFSISDNQSKISIATDIGHMTTSILDNIKNSNFLLLEANYEPDVLKCSSYPYHLKERIASPVGHLSNIEAGKTINYLADFGVKNIMLGHLSKENNYPDLAYETVKAELLMAVGAENMPDLRVAPRDVPSGIVQI